MAVEGPISPPTGCRPSRRRRVDGQKLDCHALPPADNQNRRGMELIG